MRQRIITDIEESIGHKVQTPKEFDSLSARMTSRTGQYISSTTLRRLWGYNREDVQPRRTTFNILAKFLGYADYDDYLLKTASGRPEIESNPILARNLDVNQDLREGDTITLRWFPDRECIVRYCGKHLFEILESKNTRLVVGTIFRCGLLIENEPLYINIVSQPGIKRADITYVCGKKNGITFEKTN